MTVKSNFHHSIYYKMGNQKCAELVRLLPSIFFYPVTNIPLCVIFLAEQGEGIFPEAKLPHHAFPLGADNPAMLNSMMMMNPSLRERMIQDAAKVQ